MQVYKVLGVMSGTSLDGLDLAYCEVVKDQNWEYKILSAMTISYTEKRKKILQNASKLTGEELTALDYKFGNYIGKECRKFISSLGIKPDFICSHGHTIFHQPNKGFTLQIGNGANIFAEAGIPVVCDFRSQDVAFGGQGAPLVPIGDQFLFSEFDACLNFGGFANISTQSNSERIAWDICAINVVLNKLAEKLGKSFDADGAFAKQGKLHQKLLLELNHLPFYSQSPPKSLGMEWVEDQLWHIIERYDISVQDVLHTYVMHVASIIGQTINGLNARTVLLTGGGAYNLFLVDQLRRQTKAEIIIPDDHTVQFKEALIFAFLGILRIRGEINVLKSVTGASQDHSTGVIYGQVQQSLKDI